jgi:hypothetical protein
MCTAHYILSLIAEDIGIKQQTFENITILRRMENQLPLDIGVYELHCNKNQRWIV